MAQRPPSERITAQEFWQRFTAEHLSRYPGLASSGVPLSAGSTRPSKIVDRLTGTVEGRTWEIAFRPGRLRSPETIVGYTTAVRLVAPERTLEATIPWFYAGPRPRVFSRSYLDFDRIIMRYRRREGDFRGALTSDPAFDRRWAVYPFDPVLGEAFQDSRFRTMFAAAALIGPRRAETPTVAIFGLEATLSVTIEPRSDGPRIATPFLGEFAGLLDRLEALRGLPTASQSPIEVDFLPDESDLPYPVPRVRCPTCGAESHVRFMTRLEAAVCDKCGKSIYRIQ